MSERMYAYNVFYILTMSGQSDLCTVVAPCAEMAKQAFLGRAAAAGCANEYEITKVAKVAKEYQKAAKMFASLTWDRYGRYGK